MRFVQERERRLRSRAQVKRLAILLRLRMLVRERNYVTAASLLLNAYCAWAHMYRARCRKSFINTVSIDPVTYDMLLKVFSRHYVIKSGPSKRGRPRRFTTKNNVLACLLHFYTAAVEQKTLCELFGVPPATLSRTMQDAEKALQAALRDIPEATVEWPSKEMQAEWADQVTQKENLLKGCFCVADGKNYPVQAPTHSDLQNAYYNGWLHSVKVTGVLCYGFDGTLIWGKHNFPGSWNDGEMSRQLQRVLADPVKTMDKGCCATDSAFPVSASSRMRMITPLKDGDLERASPECRLGLLAMSAAITSVRQAAEWGMGCAPKCYRRLQLPLPFDPNKRAVLLWNIYHLYNLRVRTTGISQIRAVFTANK
ncbi:hypothetical protein PHMEG_00027068 [Phytophthora megakarya]|uniref:DDE Tnp4 domain-containing protein n=1 Tax=Phytophthora megakarya TaxID=4795 RepID=A0A225V822_9STRA|nr:hypothetical protein PHMEG_00027068 [Phytophthora megakarya]